MPTYLDALRVGRLARLPSSAYVVLQAIKMQCDRKYGEARVSIQTLCRYTGLAKVTVVAAVKLLVEQNLVIRSERRGANGSKSYYVVEHFTVRFEESVIGEVAMFYFPSQMKDALAFLEGLVTEGVADSIRFHAKHPDAHVLEFLRRGVKRHPVFVHTVLAITPIAGAPEDCELHAAAAFVRERVARRSGFQAALID